MAQREYWLAGDRRCHLAERITTSRTPSESNVPTASTPLQSPTVALSLSRPPDRPTPSRDLSAVNGYDLTMASVVLHLAQLCKRQVTVGSKVTTAIWKRLRRTPIF